ncbi:MAG: M23 family metallopeptidase [Candidatus Pacearchaeota archaeon]
METQLLLDSIDGETERIRAEQQELYEIKVEWLDLFSRLLGKRVKKNFNKYNLYQKYKIFEEIIKKEIKTEEDKKTCLLAIPAYHLASSLLNLKARSLEHLNPSLFISYQPASLEEINNDKKTIGEEIELKKSLERAIKLVDSERKLIEKYQNKIKSRKNYDLGFFGKIVSKMAVAAEIAFFASLFGKECLNLYLTHKDIAQKQQSCQELIKLRKIKNLVKGIENKVFVTESKELEPGIYNLLSFVKYKKNDIIKKYLEENEIEIVGSTRPFSYPLDGLRWGDGFGVYRKNIGGDPWHTGIDCNSNANKVKAPIDMEIVETSYEKNGGFFVKGKIGKIKAGNGILKVVLLNGQEFGIKIDSLKYCSKKDGKNRFYKTHIESFDESFNESDLYMVLCHFKRNSIKVKPGDYIERGQVVGIKGKSGRASSEHLHIELRIKKNNNVVRIDPFPFFENNIIGNIDELYALSDSIEFILK